MRGGTTLELLLPSLSSRPGFFFCVAKGLRRGDKNGMTAINRRSAEHEEKRNEISREYRNPLERWRSGFGLFFFFRGLCFVRDFYEPTALNVYAVLLNWSLKILLILSGIGRFSEIQFSAECDHTRQKRWLRLNCKGIPKQTGRLEDDELHHDCA